MPGVFVVIMGVCWLQCYLRKSFLFSFWNLHTSFFLYVLLHHDVCNFNDAGKLNKIFSLTVVSSAEFLVHFYVVASAGEFTIHLDVFCRVLKVFKNISRAFLLFCSTGTCRVELFFHAWCFGCVISKERTLSWETASFKMKQSCHSEKMYVKGETKENKEKFHCSVKKCDEIRQAVVQVTWRKLNHN